MPCLKHRFEEFEREKAERALNEVPILLRNVPLRGRIYIEGDEKGQHLRLDLKGDEVELVSHELQVTYADSRCIDRVFLAMKKAKWKEIGEQL